MLNRAPWKRRWHWFGVAVGLICAGTAVLVLHLRKPLSNRPSEPAITFDGPSTSLEQTVIVPTLDTPLPKGKSAIWCASFQLAWDRMKKDVAKGPIKIENAQGVADRLNAGEFPEGSLDPESYYAEAGLVTDGIVKKILDDMAERFPESPTPDLRHATEGAVAYGYLKARVTFSIPFFENNAALAFTDSVGNSTVVRSFGLRTKDNDAYPKLRRQVSILYRDGNRFESEVMNEFVLDPCRDSAPHQIILACVDRKVTLSETLAYIQQQMKSRLAEEAWMAMGPDDTLLIPNMRWFITHYFGELEGRDRAVLNAPLRGLHVHTALQAIDFRLDRAGVEVASEARHGFKSPPPSSFKFNRPFLICMKKRGESQPFFVMWVENAELMQAW
jgi:hypothetical protein